MRTSASKCLVVGAALLLWSLVAGSSGPVGLAQDCTVTVQAGQSLFQTILQAADGAVICVGPGTFQELVLISKSITLRGAGRGQTIIKGIALAVISVLGKGEVTLQDLTVAGSANTTGIIALGTGRLNIRNVEVTQNGQSGIAISGKVNLTIENSEIARNVNAGVLATEQATLTIRGSTLSNNGNPAGEAQFGRGIELEGSSHATIEGNTITHNENWGIILGESVQVVIRSNTISENGRPLIGGGGIRVGFGNGTNAGTQAEVSQNTIEANRGCGVSVDPAIRITGSGNSLTGNRPDLCPPPGEYPWPPGF